MIFQAICKKKTQQFQAKKHNFITVLHQNNLVFNLYFEQLQIVLEKNDLECRNSWLFDHFILISIRNLRFSTQIQNPPIFLSYIQIPKNVDTFKTIPQIFTHQFFTQFEPPPLKMALFQGLPFFYISSLIDPLGVKKKNYFEVTRAYYSNKVALDF